MEPLKLEAGQIYYIKVIEFRPKNKTITKKTDNNRSYELFYVKVQDDAGREVLCEFACLQGQCKSDTFVVGVKQYIRCGILSQQGTPEIEPSDPPPHGQSGKHSNPEPESTNAFSVKVQGTAMAFSLGYAKDLLAAEVGQQEFGYKITDEDVDRMIGWADKINNALTSRLEF